MPLYDVHQRLTVRVKFRDVEAETPFRALQHVEESQNLSRAAYDAVSRSFGSGVIADVEVDDGEPPSSYTIDLVGDEEYDHTVNYDLLPDGTYGIPDYSRGAEIDPLLDAALSPVAHLIEVEKATHLKIPLLELIRASATRLSKAEGQIAIDRLDAAIASLNASRSAILDHLA